MGQKRDQKISRVASSVAFALTMLEFGQKAHSQVVTYTALDLIITRQSLLTPYALNDRDQVVGDTYSNSNSNSLVPFIYTPSTSGATRAAQLSGGTFTTVPGITASSSSIAMGINNAGLVVGSDGNTGEGFLYTTGAASATEVSPLVTGGSLSFSGVNKNGIAVGTSSTGAGYSTAVTYNLSSGTTTDIGSSFTSSLNNSYGIAINDSATALAIGAPPASTNSYGAHFQPFVAKPAAGGGVAITNVGNAVEAAIQPGGTYPGYFVNPGIGLDAQGDVAGTVGSTSTATYRPFLSNLTGYLYNGSSGSVSNVGIYGNVNAVANVSTGVEIVGSAYVYNPVTYGHEFDAFTQLNGNFVNIAYSVPGYTLTSVLAINSNGDLIASGYNNSTGSANTRYLLLAATPVPSLTYTGAVSNIWNTSAANFTPVNYADGSFVTFDDTATGSTTVSISSTVTPGSVTFNNSSKSYVVNGSAIAGGATVGLTLSGTGTVTLNNTNTFAGPVSIGNKATLIIGATGKLASNAITFSKNATLLVQNGGTLSSSGLSLSLATGSLFTVAPTTGTKFVLQVNSLTNYGGNLDLGNSDMILHNGSASSVFSEIADPYNSGIISSVARADTTHLTALGFMQNSDDGTPSGNAIYSHFDGVQVYASDVLVKYTYYGDTNLDGKVDGSDYSRIDNAFLQDNYNYGTLSGWQNGDFNYDGVIDGSDYTLIDNAFNTQGALISSIIATPTAELSSAIAPVPEPAAMTLAVVAVLGLLARRGRV
jgi:hypothetical protein